MWPGTQERFPRRLVWFCEASTPSICLFFPLLMLWSMREWLSPPSNRGDVLKESVGPEGAKDHCRRRHRGLPVKGSAFKGPGVRGSQRERARDMTYISLHLNQLWVQLRALDFQWRLKGWSKWRYKRMVFTKNTMGRWTKAGSWTNCLGTCRNIFLNTSV